MIDFTVQDISKCREKAIVCPTDTKLSGAGGVDNAIHDRAGKEFDAECKQIRECPFGKAVITSGCDLNAENVIHTAVPRSSEKALNAEYLLAACYISCLELAVQKGLQRVTFPALGAGFGGFSEDKAAEIAAEAVVKWCVKNLKCEARSEIRDHINIQFAFHNKDIMQTFMKHFSLRIVKTMQEYCSPSNLAFMFGDSLLLFFKEEGGYVTLPEPEKEITDRYRKDFWSLHYIYCEFSEVLFQIIGRPNFHLVVEKMDERIKHSGHPFEYHTFQARNADKLSFEECVCYLILLYREDRWDGGIEHVHIRHCVNGDVNKVLDRMEELLLAGVADLVGYDVVPHY